MGLDSTFEFGRLQKKVKVMMNAAIYVFYLKGKLLRQQKRSASP